MPSDSSVNKVSESSVPSKEPVLKEKEVKEAPVGRETAEAVEGIEAGVETTGRVSEILAEGREKKAGTAAVEAKKPTLTPAQIKAQLLKNVPSESVMRNQIEKEIKKEIRYLHKKAIRMLRSPGKTNYFEMSNLMKKIRELRIILNKLVKASIQKLKTLWLRFVHGVM
ncbi:hypothetical protein GF366_01690 [Candidatus Peregrinibacteria bacterium]|nr:hypothetical protein [Candidatus Peregrinibacteria bacterium]